MPKRLSDGNSNDTGKDPTLLPSDYEKSTGKSTSDNHPSEESQKKEKLPEGSRWMEDPEFAKKLLKRRSDSKEGKRDIKDIFGE